jgi:hypothetical protein
VSHLTNKIRLEREKNNLKRATKVEFNTGTRDMGYKSNNDRKEAGFIQSYGNFDDYLQKEIRKYER